MPLSLRRRSRLPEIIDDPKSLDPVETRAMLEELRTINFWLGGTRAVLSALKPLLRCLHRKDPTARLRLLDFGSGSGDIPEAIYQWCNSRGIEVCIIAADLNFRTVRMAEIGGPRLKIVQADVLSPPFRPGSFDIVLCSALLHHFSDDQIVRILELFQRLSRHSVVVSDLHRHFLAYIGIWVLTRLFSHSRAVRSDGPLSVTKAFRRSDWKRYLEDCVESEIRWRWAFRYTVRIDLSTDV